MKKETGQVNSRRRTLTGWHKCQLAIGIVGLLSLLSGVGMALASVEYFYTIVSPVSGPDTRPGRIVPIADFGPMQPTGEAASRVLNLVSPANKVVGAYRNNVRKTRANSVSADLSLTPENTIQAPSMVKAAIIKNTIYINKRFSSPAVSNNAPSTESATSQTITGSKITYPDPVENTSEAIIPSRSLLSGTKYGRKATITTSSLVETRAILAPHVHGVAIPGSITKIAENRAFHTEADGRSSIVNRTVSPMVSTTPKRISQGTCPTPNRGGSMEISHAFVEVNNLSSSTDVRGANQLVSKTSRYSNTINKLHFFTIQTTFTAEMRAYTVPPHDSISSGTSFASASPDETVIMPSTDSLTSGTEGTITTPETITISPSNSGMSPVTFPCASAPTTGAITGTTQTLTGYEPPEITPTPTPVPGLTAIGLCVLGAATAITGLWAYRRQRRLQSTGNQR